YSGHFGVKTTVFTEGSFKWNSMWVTNSTYAYLSMLHGDGFAKKFGGTSGDDPDFFTLRVYQTIDSVRTDSVDFQLADFTASNNSNDYIVNTWDEIDLSGFQEVGMKFAELEFDFLSSDTNELGIKTPAYFCLD